MEVIRVEAYIEMEIEEVVNEVAKRYEKEIVEVEMDDIFEYVSNHITYLDSREDTWGGKNRARGFREVSDGPSIEGFNERDYDLIEKELERIKDQYRP